MKLYDTEAKEFTTLKAGDIIALQSCESISFNRRDKNGVIYKLKFRKKDDYDKFLFARSLSLSQFESMAKVIAISHGLSIHPEKNLSVTAYQFIYPKK